MVMVAVLVIEHTISIDVKDEENKIGDILSRLQLQTETGMKSIDYHTI